MVDRRNKIASQHIKGEYMSAVEIEDSSVFSDDINKNTGQQIAEVSHVGIPYPYVNASVLVDCMKERFEMASPSHFGSICRVPEKFHEINKDLYTPEMVSIGPFHRGKSSLKAMDALKSRYVHALLFRTTQGGPQATLGKCIESVGVIEEEARKCYSEHINLSSNEFVDMMIHDGLFIIELFRRSAGYVKIEGYDPLVGNSNTLSTLVRDLILLENQLPMVVLEFLFNLPALKEELQGSCSLSLLALRFFNQLMPRDNGVLEKYSNCQGKHLLDLVSQTFLTLPICAITENNSWKLIPNVTELKSIGIKFKKGSKSGNFLDITFSHGVLEFPPVIIQDHTETLLGNLIAFEQCCGGYFTHMTSYVFFMNSIINSTSDVRLLKKQGIITSHLRDDEDVYNLFIKLCYEVRLGNFYYCELCDQVNTYCDKAVWHVWRARLKRCRSKNPWVLLVLMLISSLFAVATFAIHRS